MRQQLKYSQMFLSLALQKSVMSDYYVIQTDITDVSKWCGVPLFADTTYCNQVSCAKESVDLGWF